MLLEILLLVVVVLAIVQTARLHVEQDRLKTWERQHSFYLSHPDEFQDRIFHPESFYHEDDLGQQMYCPYCGR